MLWAGLYPELETDYARISELELGPEEESQESGVGLC